MVAGAAQLLVVLPTGAGKSLLFQLGSVLPAAGVTVVILPLVVLRSLSAYRWSSLKRYRLD